MIESRHRRLYIWSQPQITESQGEDTEEEPSDEAEIQPEKIELTTLHHLDTQVYSLLWRKLRIVLDYERRHRLGQRLDDTRNDQKKRPQKDEQVHEEQRQYIAHISAEHMPERIYCQSRITVYKKIIMSHGISQHERIKQQYVDKES